MDPQAVDKQDGLVGHFDLQVAGYWVGSAPREADDGGTLCFPAVLHRQGLTEQHTITPKAFQKTFGEMAGSALTVLDRAHPISEGTASKRSPQRAATRASRKASLDRQTYERRAFRQIRDPATSELGGTVRTGAGNRTMSRWVWQTVATAVRQVKQPPMCGGGPGRSRATTPLGDRDARCQACGGCALASCNCFSASEAAFASHPGAFPPASRVARR